MPIPAEPIWVHTPGRKYPIYIGHHLLSQKDFLAAYLQNKQVFILSHSDIASHYLATLRQSCEQAGASQIDHLLIPSGDQYKTLTTADEVWSALLSLNHHRDTIIIALGGGMIGDLAGFCAACYMRGVGFIQCPTTLLAQIDSAIGGKTGLNHHMGKNLIGAFYQPLAVITDITTLNTLGEKEFNSGLAELIKYGLALDKDFFVWLEENIDKLVERDPETLQMAIKRACKIKASIINEDELEKGQRIVLNFGHTVAHALESLLDYKHILHGEAVAIGMVVAVQLSLQQGTINKDVLERLISLLKKAHLPVQLDASVPLVEILTKMKHDKKHAHQRLRWVLLKTLGEPRICEEVTEQQITQALVKCGASP